MSDVSLAASGEAAAAAEARHSRTEDAPDCASEPAGGKAGMGDDPAPAGAVDSAARIIALEAEVGRLRRKLAASLSLTNLRTIAGSGRLAGEVLARMQDLVLVTDLKVRARAAARGDGGGCRARGAAAAAACVARGLWPPPVLQPASVQPRSPASGAQVARRARPCPRRALWHGRPTVHAMGRAVCSSSDPATRRQPAVPRGALAGLTTSAPTVTTRPHHSPHRVQGHIGWISGVCKPLLGYTEAGACRRKGRGQWRRSLLHAAAGDARRPLTVDARGAAAPRLWPGHACSPAAAALMHACPTPAPQPVTCSVSSLRSEGHATGTSAAATLLHPPAMNPPARHTRRCCSFFRPFRSPQSCTTCR